MKVVRFSQKGLVGSWRFDEGTGSTAKDSSPYGNHGTIYGAQRVKGIIGKALQFDGVDDYVEVPDSASLKISDTLTIAVWVKPKKLGRFQNIVNKVNPEGESPFNDYALAIDSGNKFRAEFTYDGTWYSKAMFPINAEEWQHVVLVWDRGNIKGYKNTELLYTDTVTGTLAMRNGNLLIGSYPGRNYFDGTIDEVRIYNRALSPAEIRIHYAFTKYIKPHPIIMRRKL